MTSRAKHGLEGHALAPLGLGPVLAELDRVGRAGRAIMIDSRGGPPPRNDGAFETATRPFRPRLFAGCARGGVLVKTAAGQMPLTLTMREDEGDYVVSADEEQLREHLLQAVSDR